MRCRSKLFDSHLSDNGASSFLLPWYVSKVSNWFSASLEGLSSFRPSTGLTFRASFRSIESQKVFHLLKSSVNLCQFFSLALDAHCLLEVYDVLKEWMLESRLRVNMEPALVLSWLQPKKEKQRY